MIKYLVNGLLIVSVTLVGNLAVGASSDDYGKLEQEVQALKKGQESIQSDLAEIKKMLKEGARAARGEAPFKPAEVSVAGAPYKGDKDAPITIVEFSDYQCPFCRRHAQTVMPELIKKYVDAGKVKIVMRENPIESIHKNAMGASQAALCAGEQDKYWEMHDIMFANMKNLTVDELKKYAQEIGLASTDFDACLDSGKYEAQVKKDLSEGRKLGVRGTPGFVLGLTDPKDSDKVNATKYIKGAQSIDAFSDAIDELLKPKK